MKSQRCASLPFASHCWTFVPDAMTPPLTSIEYPLHFDCTLYPLPSPYQETAHFWALPLLPAATWIFVLSFVSPFETSRHMSVPFCRIV